MFASTTTTERLLKSSGLPTNRQPTHPGQVIANDFLEPMGVTQMKAAKDLGILLARLNAIINGQRTITEETALLLERYLGCDHGVLGAPHQCGWKIYSLDHL